MSTFSTSLSGLDAEEQALSVISNDLSNLNTTAFKSGTPIFSDLFFQMLGTDGAGDPVQVGVGATMSSVDSPFTQGSITTTGVPTDVAIQGNGLFVLNQDGTQTFTRAGNFTLNSSGYLVDSNGNEVMGYPAVNGTIGSSQSLAPIIISSGQSYPPNATTNIQLDMNLDASDASLAAATGTLTVPAALPTAGQTVNVGGTTYTFATSITATSPADTVLIGANVQSTLANLAGAIDLSSTGGQAAGTTYSSLTGLNGAVTATGSNATTLTLQAIATGVGGNSLGTSTNWTTGTFGGTDLSGGGVGVAATGTLTVPSPLPVQGQTVTIGGTTYTFENSITGASAANTVQIGTDVTSTLANLVGAINASSTGGQAAGTTYGPGTFANTQVSATASNGTTLSLQAITSGAAGNSLTTTSSWDSASGIAGSFGTPDLAGGADAGAFSTPITVYDSLGNSHVLDFNFTKTAAGTWNYQITIPAADVGASGNPQVVGSGTLQFGPNGNLVNPSADVTGINVTGLSDGASTINLNWQLFSSPGVANITQTAEPSAASGQTQNGYSAGTLQSYAINASGVIDGVLSNGQTVALGQIALATFPNYDGLTNLGGNDYQTSLASGAASISAPGTGGCGTLDGGSLEASNVDIATAFTQLIQAERGYEANAKAITTADDLMQASIALIQG
jgi:flagellar hook protein FlgE